VHSWCVAVQASLGKLQKRLADAEAEELKGTGNAIVVFTYSIHKSNILDDHYRATKCAQNTLPPDLHRIFNVLTRAHSPSPACSNACLLRLC
jgi:hypothetical protein